MIFFKSERFLEEMYCKRTKVWSGNLMFLDLKIKKVPLRSRKENY